MPPAHAAISGVSAFATHSAAFAALVTTGMKKIYDWVPATPGEALMRDVLLGVGLGYMAHLCADATTAMGLPLVGKIC